MMHIVNLEEIQNLLLQVPKLIQNLERRDPNFEGSVKDWLKQAEQILSSNHISTAANIAVLRGVLISAERGTVPPDVIFNGRKSSRKIKEAVAVNILRKAEEQISNAIKGYAMQVAEGEKLARQIVALGMRKGIIQNDPGHGNHTEIMNSIMRTLYADPELGPATTHLAGLVGTHDTIILIDRMIISC